MTSRRLRVGLDARCLNTAKLRGMGRAMLAVLAHAVQRDDVEFVLMSDEPAQPMVQPASPHIRSLVWETPGHRFRIWEQWALPRTARAQGCDVLHAVGTWAPAWQPIPTVVTIHDTIPWSQTGADAAADEAWSPFFLHTVLPRAYARARLVLTPSERSRQDVVARWPQLESRTRVIPWGIDASYTAAPGQLSDALRARGVRPPYVLYFGGEIPRKRLPWAIDVWAAATASGCQLVLCGLAGTDPAAWRRRVPQARSNDVIVAGYVDEADLAGLYANADAVLYPTLYEGFGFPALEAQAVGRPVMMSAVGSLGELIGPGGVVLPVDDFEAWVAACRDLVTSRRPTNDAARVWARRFSWPTVAAQMIAAYRDASAR